MYVLTDKWITFLFLKEIDAKKIQKQVKNDAKFFQNYEAKRYVLTDQWNTFSLHKVINAKK